MKASESYFLQAGAAAVDITPPVGTLINGDFVPHYARTIHDCLYVKALILHAGPETVALVVVDICAMPRDFLDEVKAEIKQKTGIRAANVLISSTHTHASGSVVSLLLVGADLPYRQSLADKIVGAVYQAQQNLKPAQLGFGVVNVPEHVVCRRFFMKPGYQAINPVTGGQDQVKTNPFGHEDQIDRRVVPVDTQVCFLAVRGLDKAWISVLANYSLHYVGDWENGTITADYFGVFARQLGVQLGAGSDFVGIMSNGTSGEANIWDFLEPDRYPKEYFAKSELIGTDIAHKVSVAMSYVDWQSKLSISAMYADVPIPVRKPTAAELVTATAIASDTVYENIRIVDSDALRRIYAREQILLARYPDMLLFPVQAIRLGNGIIGALGGEFFAETGLALKEAAGTTPYFTVTMANGYVGYVPPAHEIERGGYETWRCRTSPLASPAEAMVRHELLSLIDQAER